VQQISIRVKICYLGIWIFVFFLVCGDFVDWFVDLSIREKDVK
jgi:hypothetical protein